MIKQADVIVGKVYAVRVSGVLSPIRIDSNHGKAGWPRRLIRFHGVNLRTGKTIHLTAARISHELCGHGGKCFKRPGHVPGHEEDAYRFCERETARGVCGMRLNAHGYCGFESTHLNQTLEGGSR